MPAVTPLGPGGWLAGVTQHTLTKHSQNSHPPLTSNEVNRMLSKPTMEFMSAGGSEVIT